MVQIARFAYCDELKPPLTKRYVIIHSFEFGIEFLTPTFLSLA